MGASVFAGNFITDRQVTTVLEKHPPENAGSDSKLSSPPFSTLSHRARQHMSHSYRVMWLLFRQYL